MPSRVPAGLLSQKHPLIHRFRYSFGLNASDEDNNSAWVTLVRSVKIASLTDPADIFVNWHNPNVVLETGPVCQPMSIIQNLRLVISINKGTTTNPVDVMKMSWTPFFCSFPEKYDAADDDTGTTVASVMSLTKDATEEDIVPLTTNKLPVDGNSEVIQPLSTVNMTEVATTHYNMTTDGTFEDATFSMDAFQQLLAHGTNRGALKACLGRTRHLTLDSGNNRNKTYFIKKFVPRNIRRIVPFTFFGILFHLPRDSEQAQLFYDHPLTGSKIHMGIKVSCRYEEWHEEHNNGMVGP